MNDDIPSAPSIPLPPSSVIRFGSDFASVTVAYLGDTLFLLFLLSGPLLKLAQSRFAVYLICSKCISTVLDLPISVLNQKFPLPYFQPLLTLSVRFHVLTLALNRAHSIFAPFHYSQHATKWLIWCLCIATWTISLGIGLAALGIDLLQGAATLGKFPTLGVVRDKCNLGVACSAFGIYMLMSVKLIWSKLLCRNGGQGNGQSQTSVFIVSQRVEKDQLRIFMVCLISVFPFLFTYIRQLPISAAPDWLESVIWLIGTISDRLSFIAEEACLLAISADFRRILKQHCRRCISTFFCGAIKFLGNEEGKMQQRTKERTEASGRNVFGNSRRITPIQASGVVGIAKIG